MYGLCGVLTGERRAGRELIHKNTPEAEELPMKWKGWIGGVLLVMMLFGTLGCGKNAAL